MAPAYRRHIQFPLTRDAVRVKSSSNMLEDRRYCRISTEALVESPYWLNRTGAPTAFQPEWPTTM